RPRGGIPLGGKRRGGVFLPAPKEPKSPFILCSFIRPLDPSRASPMDSEHRDLVTKTRALIETPRREILQLREEIESAWTTVDRTQRLLSRTEPSNRIARPAKAL